MVNVAEMPRRICIVALRSSNARRISSEMLINAVFYYIRIQDWKGDNRLLTLKKGSVVS